MSKAAYAAVFALGCLLGCCAGAAVVTGIMVWWRGV
jgi:hypothetical protein